MRTVSARRRARLWRLAAATTAAGVATGAAFLGAGPAQASSHREAPLTAGDPKVDNTDVYAFVSPEKTDTVTLIANWIPFEEPNGGPNFYPFQAGAYYDINIDNNGDGKRDVIYRWQFKDVDTRGTNTFLYNNGPVTTLDDANLLFKQTYTLTKITPYYRHVIASGVAAPSNVGPASMPNYRSLHDQAIVENVKGGGRAFAGQADDSFFLDLRVFDLLYGGNLSEVGQDTLKGYNVNTVALQVPKSAVTLHHDATNNPVIGVWSSTSKQPMDLATGATAKKSAYQQVSRLGNPLVNELVIPAGLKNAFNTLKPTADATIPRVVQAVTDPELPKLIKGIYGVPAPATPRNDLVEIYLTGIAKNAPTLDGTKAPIQADLNSQILNKDVDAKKFQPSEMLRLNTAVPVTAQPNRLGVIGGDLQGFPNGRRPTDDVVDISIQAVEGAAQTGKIVDALAAGDKVDKNDHAFDATFPYLAMPNSAAVNTAVSDNFSPFGASDPNNRGGGRTLGMPANATEASLAGVAVALLGGGLLLVGRRRRNGHPGLSA